MNNYKSLPVFNSNLKPYEWCIEELKAWCLVTGLPKQKQGVAIALSLPESGAGGIQYKVFNEIALTNSSAENGVDKLLNIWTNCLKKMGFQKYMNVFFNLNGIEKQICKN